uniref:ribonuclease H n=1 Tax=Trypanosoma congolense (strain IL3000) TaxID=1068625 RepID=G0UQD8_TRYCI|nr:putative ribonuclease H1 [Trypanosoma congolense IL3000]
MMPPSKGKRKFYAVAAGRQRGVFDTWEECQRQVTGFSGARFKAFSTLQDAQLFVDGEQSPTKQSAFAELSPSVFSMSSMPGVKRRSSEISAASDDDEGCSDAVDNFGIQSLQPEWLEARQKEAVVVYIDGACRNNGSRCGGKPPRAGFGGFYGDNDPRNFKFSLPENEPQTNQRAELSALIHVLDIAVNAHPCYNLCVYSDSKYTIMGATSYLQRWKHNGFKTAGGGRVANIDLWTKFSTLHGRHISRYAERIALEFRLRPNVAAAAARAVAMHLKYVPGHAGVYGNEMADRLAVEGCDSLDT